MPYVIRTRKDSATATEITGVGFLPAGGVAGISLEEVASKLHELQDPATQPSSGVLGSGKPLTGAKLRDTAEEWARNRGLEIVEVSDRKLTSEWEDVRGRNLEDTLPTPLEASRLAYEETYAGIIDQPEGPAALPDEERPKQGETKGESDKKEEK